MKISKKGHGLYLIFTFFSMIFYAPYSLAEQFSIDRLYPDNWYTKAREHCLLVWGTFDDIIEQRNKKIISDYLIDASVGQLTFAKRCVHNIIKNNFTMEQDDIIHLSRIIGTIQERCTRLPNTIHADKIELVKHIIEKLKKKIEVLLSISFKN